MIFQLLAFSSDTNTLIIAIMIPVLGIISPLLVANQVNKNKRAEKEQDWARQDKVAEHVAQVAKEAAEAARFVVKTQTDISHKTDEIVLQVEKIHGLVNSQMTQALRSELAATQETLVVMNEQNSRYQERGEEIPPLHMEAFRIKEAKINELRENLKVREEADKVSKAVNTGPIEVVVVNPDPVPVHDIPISESE